LLAGAFADYFSFAALRLPAMQSGRPATGPDAGVAQWREFLLAFNESAARHFAALDQLLTRLSPVTEWRTASKIDADVIVEERTRYQRVKAAIP
jgi:hypothetical protein